MTPTEILECRAAEHRRSALCWLAVDFVLVAQLIMLVVLAVKG